MSDKATFAVQVDRESELYEDFEEYQERGGFESRSEVLRYLMRQEFYENPDQVTVEEMRDELDDLKRRQETPMEKGGYLLAAVVAGTAPLVGLFASTLTSPTLAFASGMVVAFVGLLAGAVTKIIADNARTPTPDAGSGFGISEVES